jgi:hypothetical protein
MIADLATAEKSVLIQFHTRTTHRHWPSFPLKHVLPQKQPKETDAVPDSGIVICPTYHRSTIQLHFIKDLRPLVLLKFNQSPIVSLPPPPQHIRTFPLQALSKTKPVSHTLSTFSKSIPPPLFLSRSGGSKQKSTSNKSLLPPPSSLLRRNSRRTLMILDNDPSPPDLSSPNYRTLIPLKPWQQKALSKKPACHALSKKPACHVHFVSIHPLRQDGKVKQFLLPPSSHPPIILSAKEGRNWELKL